MIKYNKCHAEVTVGVYRISQRYEIFRYFDFLMCVYQERSHHVLSAAVVVACAERKFSWI